MHSTNNLFIFNYAVLSTLLLLIVIRFSSPFTDFFYVELILCS